MPDRKTLLAGGTDDDTLAEPGHANPPSTSPALQSDNLEFKGYEVRPEFESPQLDDPAGSAAQFLTAAYI